MRSSIPKISRTGIPTGNLFDFTDIEVGDYGLEIEAFDLDQPDRDYFRLRLTPME